MHWLQALDVAVFRFINETLSNPLFDVLMPLASGQGSRGFFFALVGVSGLLLLWKGGVRGRLCVLMLALILWPGDSLICNTIKHAVARPRPFLTLPDVRRPGSKSNSPTMMTLGNSNESSPGPKHNQPESGRDALPRVQTVQQPGPAGLMGTAGHNSMPSSHAANWFAATLILLVYYRRTWRFMLPLALIISYSRIYIGVHYPSDVLAGAIVGAGYAAAALLAINALWQWAGRNWFPLEWEQLPSLLNPAFRAPKSSVTV